MCCDLPAELLAPPGIAAELAAYRQRLAERGVDWDDEWPAAAPVLFDCMRFASRTELMQAWGAGPEAGWEGALLRCLPEQLPAGLVVARVGPAAIELEQGARPWALPGRTSTVSLLMDSRCEVDLKVDVNGVVVELDAGAARLVQVALSHDVSWLRISAPEAGLDARTEAVEPVGKAVLVLESDNVVRWSVEDDRQGGWYPDGEAEMRDCWERPWFHARSVRVDVPVVPLRISAARGLEYYAEHRELRLEAGSEVALTLNPRRRIDPAARGWYGGDLHVHMNYSGESVREPHDVARMQMGEGLHLMNLVAGNMTTSLVYDRASFEHFLGQDLPWSAEDQVARWGVEYRNDLLGHFHALAPAAVPTRYHTGHRRSDLPHDWPPNASACQEMRDAGATVGYTHPVFVPMEGDDPSAVFVDERSHSVEARELVADAALGLVDSVDLLGPSHAEGTARLYRRLLGCGFHLAATVGTDVQLSRTRAGLFSNPPGWGRGYAYLGAARLDVAAYQEAVRACRTIATNGPWIELCVAGEGPGSVLDGAAGRQVDVRVDCNGPGVEDLELVGPSGVVASVSCDPVREGHVLECSVVITEPTWIVAIARGGPHPDCLGEHVFAHTSPVWADVDGRSVARAVDAKWCLDWLDRFEGLCRRKGSFADDGQLAELVAVIDAARAVYRRIAALRR